MCCVQVGDWSVFSILNNASLCHPGKLVEVDVRRLNIFVYYMFSIWTCKKSRKRHLVGGQLMEYILSVSKNGSISWTMLLCRFMENLTPILRKIYKNDLCCYFSANCVVVWGQSHFGTRFATEKGRRPHDSSNKLILNSTGTWYQPSTSGTS